MHKDITGIILSGGKSSRMGINKSLIEINGEKIISKIYNLLKELFEEVIIVANESNLYDFLEAKIVSDIYQNKGPLGGIHAGLVASKNERCFIISCDLPMIDKDTIEFIIEKSYGFNLSLPFADGYVQELCGIYSKEYISKIEEKLKESEQEIRHHEQKHRACKVHGFIKQNNANIIDIDVTYENYNNLVFFNLNTKEDLEKLQKLL